MTPVVTRADDARGTLATRTREDVTLRSQKLRMLLTRRKLLQSKATAIDNDLRGKIIPVNVARRPYGLSLAGIKYWGASPPPMNRSRPIARNIDR
jgi:hypothetical protein